VLLRKLEAHGFKSFADRTELEFDEGITAIVGPNGSGKSNISDAILWVLGEQSAKTLRGAKMEDVIFSGSAGRRPLGMAEVSLTFDNTDGTLPIEYSEVIFTRRVYRSGESEYYLNKRPCRLKDIHELLAHTGLGKDSMVVIGQNRVDEVLNSKPEERRLLFEDAAGISKYKQRKRDAVRKMEETELNLTRVADIRGEIASRLEPMAESARKAKEHKELARQLRSQQVSMLCQRLEQAQVQQERWRGEAAELQQDYEAGRTSLYAAESEAARCSELRNQAEAAWTGAQEQVRSCQEEGDVLQQQQAVLAERSLQEEERSRRLAQEQVEYAQLGQRTRAQGENVSAEWQQQAGTLLQCTKEVSEREATLQQLQEELTALETQVVAGKEAEMSRMQNLLQLRHEVQQQEQEGRRLEEELVSVAGEEIQQQQQLDLATRQEKALHQQKDELQERMRAAKLQGQQLQQLSQCKREELQQRQEKLQKRQLQQREWTTRRQVLQQMKEAHEGFGRGVKALLQSKAAWRSGIHGPVAELIRVSSRYVTAVETALGGAMQHVVVEREEVARDAIAFLKEQRLGRATFLPLSALRPQTSRDAEMRAVKLPGALGFASDMVEYLAEHEKAVRFLLGRTVIVETLDQAIAIARQTGHSVKLVTLDGEVLSPGGAMSGGSQQRRESGVLGRESELEELSRCIAEGTEELQAAETQLKQLQQDGQELQGQLEQIRQQLQELQVEHTAWTGQSQACLKEMQRWQEAGENLKKRREELELALTQVRQQRQELTESLASFEAADHVQREDVSSQQEQQVVLTRRREEEQSRLMAAKVRQAALEEQRRQMEERLRSMETELDHVKRKQEQLLAEHGVLQAQQQETQQSLATVRTAQEKLIDKRKEAEETAAQAQTERAQQEAIWRQALEAQEVCRRQNQDLERKVHAIELQTAKADYEVEAAQTQLWEQFSLRPQEAQEWRVEGNTASFNAAIARLERDIEALGPVNLNAEQEYVELLERHEFLEGQFEDLASSLEQLRQVIAEMDATMSSQFKEAFHRINEYFSASFQSLFGGGKAELRLTAPDNLLETGIEIFVQPPGKKTQHLALLSGGERALTVIALLFSFLRHRPAPFCMVDEIDAPLDEANLRRFSRFLHEYAAHTQFLVVTHRKGTMEAADRLHGVTLHENGVSRIISVELGHEEKQSSVS
jgi:chromosome segregation protein